MPTTRPHTDLAGIGIYSLAEAARYTRVSPQRIRHWVCGYAHGKGQKKRVSPPVWSRDIPEMDGEVAVSFLDLIEVRFVDAFRKRGVPWPEIRLAQKEARKLLATNHPFATRRWVTDRQTIMLRSEPDAKGFRELLGVVSSQWEFDQLVRPYLVGVEFDDQDRAIRWRPAGPETPIVLDPKRRSGQPIVDACGIPTAILTDAVRAEGSEESVAEWYDIPVDLVHAAVEFERQYAS